jgi:hypothetical protein
MGGELWRSNEKRLGIPSSTVFFCTRSCVYLSILVTYRYDIDGLVCRILCSELETAGDFRKAWEGLR